MKFKICFIVFCFSTLVFSQNRIKTINELIVKNLFDNPIVAKKYSHKLLKIAKEDKLQKDESRAYFFLAELSGNFSQKDSAFYYYDKAIQKAVEINDEKALLYYKVNKANFLFNGFDFDSALNLYNECLSVAKKNNDNFTYDYIQIKQGNVKYEIGKYKEALEIFKKGYKRKDFQKQTALGIQLSLSKIYLKINEPDSSLIFSKKGIIESKKLKLAEFEMHFLNQSGLVYIYTKNFEEAKKSFEEALLLSEKNEMLEMTRAILINQSKLYTVLRENNKAIGILKKIVTNEEKVVISSETQAEIDYLLAENYKAINDLNSSNFYLQKFIIDEEKLGQKKIETIDFLHQLDINIINNEREKQVNQKQILTILLTIIIIIMVLFYYKKRRFDQLNQLKFDSLISKIHNYEQESVKKVNENLYENLNINALNLMPIVEEKLINNFVLTEKFENKDFTEYRFLNDDFKKEEVFEEEVFEEEIEDMPNNSFIIKHETINEILEKLIKLEEKKYFLKQECTLHNVAKKLKTNTAYLSKIVNNELGKNFSTYINELRINYVIIELKNNSKLRSYSVNAIAEEVGYKGPESFTKYFKVATGISPTIYIKKINKLQENKKNKIDLTA
jgi:AraC-like DNA-binding protein